MSKRFGRNQRRKLSQQLAAQQAETERFLKAYQLADGLARHASRQLAQATHDLKVLYHEIGKNLNAGHPLLPDHVRRQLDVESAALVRVRIPSEQMTIRMVDVLRKGVVTDEFKNRVAIRLAHGYKTVGYAVDIQSLQMVSFRDEYIDELSRDIARYLVEALTEQGGE